MAPKSVILARIEDRYVELLGSRYDGGCCFLFHINGVVV